MFFSPSAATYYDRLRSTTKRLFLLDSDIAEAMALKLGLKFAWYMLFLNLIAESDSLNTIATFRDQHHVQSYIGPILDDYKLLFSSFHSYD